jgi:anti-anti-sigma factor
VVVIDLEQVSLFNAIGLRFLVEAQERADLGGWALVIVAPRDPAYRVIALAGLDDRMNVSRRPARLVPS